MRSIEMGGVQKVILDVLKHLPKDKFDLTLMVNLYQGELREQIPKDIKLIKICSGKEDFGNIDFFIKFRLALRRIKLAVLEKFPSLLRVLYYKDNYAIEVASGRSELEQVLVSARKNTKKLAWVHWEFSHEPKVNKSDYIIQLLKKFDHIIFCSANVQNQIKEIYQVKYPSTSVFHNVIHPKEIIEKVQQPVIDKPNFKDNLFTFSSIGRVKIAKGYPLLIEMHKKLINDGYNHRVIILGDGSETENIQKKIKQYNVENTFILLGNKNNPFPYIADSDAFILPTKTEAYPLSIKEALILGLPVLATDVGGVSEIVDDGIDGILMQYDENDIYEKMKKIITDKDFYSQLKEGASKAKGKFETDRIYKKIQECLIQIANDSKS